MEVAGQVEEVNGQCDMIHQDAGNFKTRSTISLLLGTLTRVPCNAEKVAEVVEEVSRRCDSPRCWEPKQDRIYHYISRARLIKDGM